MKKKIVLACVMCLLTASNAYPDPTQYDRKSPYHDPAATREQPRWFLVDVGGAASSQPGGAAVSLVAGVRYTFAHPFGARAFVAFPLVGSKDRAEAPSRVRSQDAMAAALRAAGLDVRGSRRRRRRGCKGDRPGSGAAAARQPPWSSGTRWRWPS